MREDTIIYDLHDWSNTKVFEEFFGDFLYE